MNSLNNQQILGGFIRRLLDTERVIPYNPHFMDHELRSANNEISFMPAVKDLKHRVLLNPGEWAASYAEHPNPKYKHTSNVMLMRGTEYGVIIVYGVKAQYDQRQAKNGNGFKTEYLGPVPRLNTTTAFTMAMMRHFKRIGKPVSLIGSEAIALEWIFSANFNQDLVDQAKADSEAGVALGDGLPSKQASKRPGNGKAPQFAKPAGHNPTANKPQHRKPNAVVGVPGSFRKEPTQSKRNVAHIQIPANTPNPQQVVEQAVNGLAMAVDMRDSKPAGKHPQEIIPKDATPTPNQVMQGQQGIELHAHPMDIVPCRANNFQGRKATEEEKKDFAEKIEEGEPIGLIDSSMAGLDSIPDLGAHTQHANA